MSSLFGPPLNVSVAEALYLIFSHYCSPWKSPISNSNGSSETGSSNIETPGDISLMLFCYDNYIAECYLL